MELGWREWLAGCRGTWRRGTVAPPARARPSAAASRRVAHRDGHRRSTPAQLGLTLMHEHVLVDFIGAAEVSPARYDADAVFTRVAAVPASRRRALGAATLVECTPAYLGRDPRLLRRLAEASGLHILSNTGYYGANKDKHLPPHAFTETPQQLAARWIREHEQGIDGTGIKPAFMKIGVDAGPLSEVDAKLVRAAAITHAGDRPADRRAHRRRRRGRTELDILERAGVPLSSFIWVHAHSEQDGALHAKAAGARRLGRVRRPRAERASTGTWRWSARCSRPASSIACWCRTTPAGIASASRAAASSARFDTLFTAFVPALKTAGVTEAEIDQLLIDNPRRALTPRA